MASFGSAHSATVNYATPLKQEINYFQIQFTSKFIYNLTISNYNQIIIQKITQSNNTQIKLLFNWVDECEL